MRNPKAVDGLDLYRDKTVATLQDIFLKSVKLYKNNRLFGSRDPISKIY